jgi:sugar phosphate isomerase/epimerase
LLSKDKFLSSLRFYKVVGAILSELNTPQFSAGISTASLYPYLLEDAFRLLAENGVLYTEIFVNTESELSGVYLDRIKSITSEYGIKTVSVHPFTCGLEPMMMYTEYERRTPDFLQFYSRYFAYMNAVGAKYFILHGNKPPAKIPESLEFERFLKLADRAAEYGVTVLQENVSRCLSRDLKKLVRMKEALGDTAAFVLDVKQARRSGYHPIECVKALGSSIKHIHYSDAYYGSSATGDGDTTVAGKQDDCLFFTEGNEDYAAFFKAAAEAGINAAVLLETYRDREDSEYDRKLIGNYKTLDNYLKKGEYLL